MPIILGGITGLLVSFWMQRFELTQTALHQKKERLELIIESSNIGLWDWNMVTNELYFDKGWCKLLGCEVNDIKPTFSSWESRVHPDDLEQCYKDVKSHINGETPFYSNVHRMRHKDGHWVYILDRGRIVERDKFGQPIRLAGTHSDITHIKEIEKSLEISNQKLKELSLIDGLTGLKNRRALDEHLKQQWGFLTRKQIPFSTLMLDIDYFKEFNDIYGHLKGDYCLKEVAKKLIENVKRTNDIACRYGGEEFVIIYSGIRGDQALEFADLIKQKVEELKIPHEGSKCSDYVTVSIGVNYCDHSHCSTAYDAIDQADKALYMAKEQGRNCTVLLANTVQINS